ncbi:MAG: peptidoglycan DD-metalloendopeptidase family protein [Melioribacteraceae bacterium]|nr:peptidoglycan DD-metalloendopeptidase family protein [Melioribacteraceae bacterium]
MNSYCTKHLLIVLLLTFPILFSCSNKTESESEKEKIEIPMPNIYGLFTDTLKVFEGVVKKNETLTDILLPHNISYKTISKIAEIAKEKFNVRKINSGKKYKIYSQIDSVETVHYFVYESSPVNFAIINFTDSVITISTGAKEIELRERTASGIITNSLYMTLKNQKISDLLALKMAEVYAWQIDFYHVQEGDNFKVIFEEKFIDGEFVGVGDIKSAYFQHRKNNFYAFYYEQNGDGEYFDEEGNSLRKAFLKSPLKFGRMTSSFSRRRFHPVLHKFKAHLGTDYAAPSGTPIHATGDGVVIEARYKRSNGNYVKIRHNGTFMTQYLHMSKIANGIRTGVAVKQDQVIGFVGMTGLATGPHVCYRFWKNGEQVNHRREKVKSSNPIAKENSIKYQIYIDSVKTILDSIAFAQQGATITSKN